MGKTTTVKEKYEAQAGYQKVFSEHEAKEMLESIASQPFQVEFNLSILKVTCGNGFSAILTTDGRVFTWGSNMFG
jgi:alpha-tubulin suppressor-like RCC1 family protein